VIKSLLYSRPFDAPSLRWGRTHEDDARKAYIQDMAARGEHVELLQSGLVIDQRDPCLACSPDNFVRLPSGEVGLVEHKCPHKAAKDCLTPEQAAATLKGFCSVLNSKGILELKRTHSYFYQVQGSLAITCKPWCHFNLLYGHPRVSVSRLSKQILSSGHLFVCGLFSSTSVLYFLNLFCYDRVPDSRFANLFCKYTYYAITNHAMSCD